MRIVSYADCEFKVTLTPPRSDGRRRAALHNLRVASARVANQGLTGTTPAWSYQFRFRETAKRRPALIPWRNRDKEQRIVKNDRIKKAISTPNNEDE